MNAILSMVALAAMATSVSANNDSSNAKTPAIRRSLQADVSVYESTQTPRAPWCKPGFVDKTNSKAMFWKCGNSCPGSYGGWTDGCCECACVPPGTPPTICAHPVVDIPGLASPTPAPVPISQPGQPQVPDNSNNNNNNQQVNVRNELDFLAKTRPPQEDKASAAPEGSDEGSGMSVALVVLTICAALCIIVIFFSILILMQGCPACCNIDWLHGKLKNKPSRVQPVSDPVVMHTTPDRGSWNLEDAYPQGYTIDMKKVNGDLHSSCDTGSTRSPGPSPRNSPRGLNTTPRSLVTATHSDGSWRSPRSCPERQSMQSYQSAGQPAVQKQFSTASYRSSQPTIQKQLSTSSYAGQPTVVKQISTSSRRGSGALLTPDEVRSSSVRSQSTSPPSPRAVLSDLGLQEHGRARSSSPRPSSSSPRPSPLRSAADTNQQPDGRGRASSRSVSPSPRQPSGSPSQLR